MLPKRAPPPWSPPRPSAPPLDIYSSLSPPSPFRPSLPSCPPPSAPPPYTERPTPSQYLPGPTNATTHRETFVPPRLNLSSATVSARETERPSRPSPRNQVSPSSSTLTSRSGRTRDDLALEENRRNASNERRTRDDIGVGRRRDRVDTVQGPARFELKTRKMGRKANPTLYVDRGCTDVICSLLFIVALVGWGVVAVIAFMWGNPERLIFPTDSLGRTCGTAKTGAYDLTSRPYLLFFDITKCISFATVFAGCQTPQTCVSTCPDEYFSYLQLQTPFANIAQAMNTSMYCLDGVNKSNITTFAQVQSLVNTQQCAAYTVTSAPVLGRCIPTVVVGAVDGVGAVANATANSLDQIAQQVGTNSNIPNNSAINDSAQVVSSLVSSSPWIVKVANDISVSWWAVLSLILLAGFCSFVFTLVLRVFGGLVIWASILIVVAAFAGGAGFSWWKWWSLTQAGAVNDYSFQPMFYLYFEMPTTWMVIGIVLSLFLLLTLLILCCVFSRIRIATAMIEESSKAIGSMLSTLLFPLFPFALHIAVILIWASITIWLASSGQDNCRNLNQTNATNPYGTPCDCSTLGTDPTCSYVNLTRQIDKIAYLQGANLFIFFWVTCFITGLGQISLAGAFASHYWATDKNKDLPTFPVFRALKIALRYHVGSLAFGSLLLAITKFIRVILDFLDKQAKTTKNVVLHYFLLLFKCCFWCLDVFLKFLTKNAFIMMAIYGRNFCTSASESFGLLARNIIRVVVVNNVTGFLLLLGRLVVTAGMGVVAYFYFSGQWVINGLPTITLYYYFVPIILVVIGSYFIADIFFDVYEMAVDTTFICFLEDSEQNDGSAQKPFYMSANLQKILGVRNDKSKA